MHPANRMLAAGARLAAFGLALLGLSACGNSETPSAHQVCAPGRSQTCDCEFSAGVQTCRADGSGFDECAGCFVPPPVPRAGFLDETKELVFVGEGGACLAIEDFDRDGTLDLMYSVGSIPTRVNFFRGVGDGRFAVPGVARLDEGVFEVKCVVGDFDNDGFTDVIEAAVGKGPEQILIQYFRNKGNFEFELQENAIDLPTMPDHLVVGITAWDYDNDGWLDFVVGRFFGVSGPGGSITDACKFVSDADFRCLVPQGNNPGPKVYHNERNGTFKLDVNLLKPPFPSTTNAMAIGDLNRDGKTDLFMSNDYYANHLHLSSPNGYFHGEIETGVGEYNHGMGATIADFNGDGRLDVYGVDIGPNNLWLSGANTLLINSGLKFGIATPTHFHSNWAPVAEDFDLDGRPDIYVNAAAVVANNDDMILMANSIGKIKELVSQYDLVFWNEYGQGFSHIKIPHRGFSKPNVIYGTTAVADTDGDGDLDIMSASGEPLTFRYLKNQQQPGQWLVVDVEGTKSNRNGIGVEVQLFESGKLKQLRTIGSQGSLGQSWPMAHFGLGDRTVVEEVHVHWTTGKTQVIKNVKANQVLKVLEE